MQMLIIAKTRKRRVNSVIANSKTIQVLIGIVARSIQNSGPNLKNQRCLYYSIVQSAKSHLRRRTRREITLGHILNRRKRRLAMLKSHSNVRLALSSPNLMIRFVSILRYVKLGKILLIALTGWSSCPVCICCCWAFLICTTRRSTAHLVVLPSTIASALAHALCKITSSRYLKSGGGT